MAYTVKYKKQAIEDAKKLNIAKIQNRFPSCAIPVLLFCFFIEIQNLPTIENKK